MSEVRNYIPEVKNTFKLGVKNMPGIDFSVFCFTVLSLYSERFYQ